jgi:hypothetical protein
MVPELVAIALVLGVALVYSAYDGTRYLSAARAADVVVGLGSGATGAIVLSPAVWGDDLAYAFFVGFETVFGLLFAAAVLPRPSSRGPSPETCLDLITVAMTGVLASVTVLPVPIASSDPTAAGVYLTYLCLFYFAVARKSLE